MPSNNTTDENLDPFNTNDSEDDDSSPTEPSSSPSPFDNFDSTTQESDTDHDEEDLPITNTDASPPQSTTDPTADVPANNTDSDDPSYSPSFLYPLVNKAFSIIGTGFYVTMTAAKLLATIFFAFLYVWGPIPGAVIAFGMLIDVNTSFTTLAFLNGHPHYIDSILSIILVVIIMLLVRHAILIDEEFG